MQRLSDFLDRITSGWSLILFLGLFILTTSVLFPWFARVLHVPEDNVEKIDLKFFYEPEELRQSMESYGEQGRKAYALSHLTADVIFPIVYTFLFSIAITFFFQRIFPSSSWLQELHLLPFLLLIFDLIENLIIAALLLIFPAFPLVLGVAAGIVTAIKWLLSGIIVSLTVLGLLIWGLKPLFRKGKGGS